MKMDFKGELINIIERYSKEITDLLGKSYPEKNNIEELALDYSYKIYNKAVIRKFRSFQNEIYYKLYKLLEKIEKEYKLQTINDSLFEIYTTVTGDNKISVQEFINKYTTVEEYYNTLKKNGIYYEINFFLNKMIIESQKVKLK